MKALNTLLVAITLSVSSLAVAEGGADRALAKITQAQQTSTEAQVAQQGKSDAETVKASTRTNC